MRQPRFRQLPPYTRPLPCAQRQEASVARAVQAVHAAAVYASSNVAPVRPDGRPAMWAGAPAAPAAPAAATVTSSAVRPTHDACLWSNRIPLVPERCGQNSIVILR